MKKIKFILHGNLGRKFGAEWMLCVSTIGEAIRAIASQRPGFSEYVCRSGKKGVEYGIQRGEQQCSCKEDVLLPIDTDVIHIVPVIKGFGGGKWWAYVLAGVAMIAIGWTGIGGVLVAGMLVSMGVALAFSGIAMALAPSKNIDKDKESLASSAFGSGDINSAVQGVPVPLAYGGPLLVGSQIINAQIVSKDLPLTEEE